MAVGTLMNARGLMELITTNIGLQKGIIGPALFLMLNIIAILTTSMASPLFEGVPVLGASWIPPDETSDQAEARDAATGYRRDSGSRPRGSGQAAAYGQADL